MGFWSGLGKGLLGAGGAIAAPFTGGASLAATIPAIIGGAGAVASGISSGRAEGRKQEAGINQNQDLLKMRAAQMMEDALMNRGQLDLQQRQYALSAPGKRAGNSVRGDILSNGQDFQINGPIVHTGGKMPQITGGLRPSMFSDSTRQLGGQISRDALLQQMQGDKFDPLPMPNVPEITPPPQAGGLDTALNIVGGVGAGIGAISPFLNKSNPYQVKRPPVGYDPEDWQTQGAG